MRTASVRSPRRTRKQSNGPGTAPMAFCRNRRRAATSSSFVTATPRIVSECPPRYLVAEWNTTSAPSSRGRWRAGEAKVLSTTRSGAATTRLGGDRRSSRATAAMSVTLSSGLDGVSNQTRRVALRQRLPTARPVRTRGPRTGPPPPRQAGGRARGSGTCRRTRRHRPGSPRRWRRAGPALTSSRNPTRRRSRGARPRGPRPRARVAPAWGSAVRAYSYPARGRPTPSWA